MPNRRELGYVSAGSTNTVYVSTGIYGRATGGIGSPTAVTISGVNYEYLTFNATGTLTVTTAGWFDYLAVGGGGGNHEASGSSGGGGGGSGVLLIGSIYLDANQTITIGGGSSRALYYTLHTAGDTTIAATSPFSVTAGGNVSILENAGFNVPSVGGQPGCVANATRRTITQAYGFMGGSSVSHGGGGGGSTSAGTSSTSTVGGAGGAGFDVSVFIGGSELRKAMGAGGGAPTTGGAAPTGGVAGSNNTTPPNGNANSGGGGGGGMNICTTGNGGSGICYIRWKV